MFEPFSRRGVGVHTGAPCQVRVESASSGHGLVFVTDQGRVPVRPEAIDPDASRATDLICDGARIRTVEHLLAALAWFGVHDAAIRVDGPEIPILDGSAGPWAASLLAAGATPGPRLLSLAEPVEVELGESRASLTPIAEEDAPVYRVELRFDGTSTGPPAAELDLASDDFVAAIAPARTFALERDVEAIREQGLGRGGCLDNALIIGEHGPLNPCGARFTNEPARHKLLDAIGDLALLGGLPRATLVAVKPGHKLMHELVRSAATPVVGAVG